MKIGNFLDKALTGISSRPEGVNAARPSGRTASLDGGLSKSATVTLSTAASIKSEDTATFDAAKVARLRQAIADGSYRANAESIADKMLGNAKELISGR